MKPRPRPLHPACLERLRLLQRRALYIKLFSYVDNLHIALYRATFMLRSTHRAGE